MQEEQGVAEGNGHILVVDDNRLNRLKLSRGLEQQGHAVALAENGHQALEMLRDEPFDVVLLDIIMPEMDGYEVLSQIKSDIALRDIPVIVISALDEMESVVRCIEMGAEDYLPKPFDPVLLKARLKTSLEKKKLRDLERAYLRQEMMLRQSEKLATLGKLCAGVAHELNNPSAAAQRSAKQLQEAFARTQEATLYIDQFGLSDRQVEALASLHQQAQERANHPVELDSVTRSDQEYELESWLDDHGIEEPWEIAHDLTHLGYDREQLDRLAERFTADQLPTVLAWLGMTYTVYALLNEIYQGTSRISEIVEALKSYTFMDQAPLQLVDVHEGLNNTLVILRSKLKHGIQVRREYDPALPSIQAYGSELNQVWTNIIDNAAAAMEEQGELILRTRQEGPWVVVEIEDSGPGIPEEIQPKIFDPFFTTRPPGRGTGLGLNITHNIVQKHKGQIKVYSQPGKTSFEVKLPINFEALP
ncbi:MAG: response regulator [Chloroflexota bacterium]|nr:response regulator [Chloroflexota bacterium]